MAKDLDRSLHAAIDLQQETLEIPGISAAVIFPDGSTWHGVSGKSSDSDALFSSLWASGAMHSTAADLARFVRDLFGGGIVR